MAAAIKRCPNVIEVFWQWHAKPSFLSPDDRHVNDDAVQVEQYTGISTIFEGVQARAIQSAKTVTILNLTVFHGTNGPEPAGPLRYLRHLR